MQAATERMGTAAAVRPARFGGIGAIESRSCQFAILLAFAMLIRLPAFGEWNYDVDVQYYALVGQRMLDGATLYVDIWDRKPPGLYLIYALIGLVSREAVAWQLAATLATAAGGYGVARVARLASGPAAALLAGVAYVALLGRFGGEDGQAPVFYNPLMLLCAWSILTRIDLLTSGRIDRRLIGGFVAAGAAITIKQSAAVEALFFGAFAGRWLLRRGALAPILTLALAGAAPMLLVFGYYAAIGHWPELWQALVRSNEARLYPDAATHVHRFATLMVLLAFPLGLALLGGRALLQEPDKRPYLVFVGLWAAVAIGAVAVYPHVFPHYALPLLAPLCVLSAPFLGSPRIGSIALASLLAFSLWGSDSLDLPARRAGHRTSEPFAAYVAAETPGKRLLIAGMPSFLYQRIGAAPPSVLAFPSHLYDGSESGVSGIDEVAEMKRILAARPETVVVERPVRLSPRNEANFALTEAYVRACGKLRRFTIYDHDGARRMWVYSRCAA